MKYIYNKTRRRVPAEYLINIGVISYGTFAVFDFGSFHKNY